MSLTLLEPIIVNTAATFTFANANITANMTAGNVKTNNLLYANGTPYVFTTNAAGSNTQVQFNNANSFAGSSNFTFDTSTNTLSVTNITANGAGLSSLIGANVTGQVGNAVIAGTVYTNAQPNITSVGTLTSLNVNGTITGVNFTANTGVFTGNGSALTNLNGANVTGQVGNALVAGTVYTNAQPNITSVGLLTSLSVGPNSSVTLTGTSGFVRANAIQGIDGVAALYPAYNGVTGAAGVVSNLTVGIGASGSITANGNVTANFYIGNGSSLSSITGSNVTGQVGNALVAGTVYTNAQPNITSVGTLTSLAVSGNANFSNTTSLQQTTEVIAPITGATGTVTHNFLNGSVFYHTSISANFLPNFTNIPTTNDRVTIVSLILNQGATAYVPNTSNIQIAGSNVAVKWIGGTPPEGTASGIDSISYALIRSSSAWVVTGSYGSYS